MIAGTAWKSRPTVDNEPAYDGRTRTTVITSGCFKISCTSRMGTQSGYPGATHPDELRDLAL